MLHVKNQIKTYFEKQKINLSDDFGFKISNGNKVHYISKEKAKLIHKNHSCTVYNHGVRLQEFYDEISSLRCYEYILAQYICGLVKLIHHEICDICIGTKENIRQQVLFTYSLKTFIDKFYPDLTFVVEEDFLTQKRFSNFYRGTTRGPKIDILFESIKTIIEFDERHHGSYEHTVADAERDALINALGYKVLRVKHTDDFPNFFKNRFSPIIDERIFLHDPTKLKEYVVKLFCDLGHDKEHIGMLVNSQCDDIINGVDAEMIGMTPENVSVRKLMNYLNFGFDEDKIEIITEILSECEYPYIENDDSLEIILSPNAMEYILSMISIDDCQTIVRIRKLYTDIKQKFLLETYNTAIKSIELRDDTVQSIISVSTNAYNRSQKDEFLKAKIKDKKIAKQERELAIYKNHFEYMLPKNDIGRIKEALPNVSTELINGKAFIAEIPQLVYSDNESDYIDLNEIKLYIDINIKIFKFNGRSVERIISTIRSKLNKPKSKYNNGKIMNNCKFLI